MSGDCIYNSQNSNEIRKELKKGKSHDAFYLLRNQHDAFYLLRNQLLDYPKNVSFGHLNINSLRKKFK